MIDDPNFKGPNPDEIIGLWVYFGTDFNAHYAQAHTENPENWHTITAACGISAPLATVEAVYSPLFRCLNCIYAANVPTAEAF